MTTKVSVPYWGSLSSNKKLSDTIPKLDDKFPSPTGVLYLLIMAKARSWVKKKSEFPSPTGVLYLLIIFEMAKEGEGEFPSPTGVLYLLMKCGGRIGSTCGWFPSPTGVLYLLIPPLQIQYLCASIIHFAWQKIFL